MAKQPRNALGAGMPPGVSFPGFRKPVSNFDAVRQLLQTRPLAVDIDLSTARSFAAGTALKLPISGNSFFIDQKPNSGYSTCYVQDENAQGNTPITIYPGAVLRVPFTYLVFENIAQPGQVMRVIYGVDLDFVPALSAGLFGAVNIVDGGRLRTEAGVAFHAGGQQALLAGNNSHVQLWNKAAAGSGLNLIVGRAVGATDTAATQIGFRFNNAVLTTLISAPNSKYLGGAASVNAEVRSQNNVGVLGTGMGSVPLAVNTPFTQQTIEPVIVPPQTGLIVANFTLAQSMYAMFDFYEKQT